MLIQYFSLYGKRAVSHSVVMKPRFLSVGIAPSHKLAVWMWSFSTSREVSVQQLFCALFRRLAHRPVIPAENPKSMVNFLAILLMSAAFFGVTCLIAELLPVRPFRLT